MAHTCFLKMMPSFHKVLVFISWGYAIYLLKSRTPSPSLGHPPKVVIQDWLPSRLCSNHCLGLVSVMTMGLHDFSPRKLDNEPTEHEQTVFNHHSLRAATVISPDHIFIPLELTV